MKPKDVIRYENRFFVILEILENENYGCRCINDGEEHVLKANEVVLVQSYQKQRKSFKASVIDFYRWLFSNKFDMWLKNHFFNFIRYFFVFCCAVMVYLFGVIIYTGIHNLML